ncbi:MAG: hypothetical protein LBU42_03315 [Prevotellaceae bacterium]|jgi:hypothetical protein|nr:hypothetical protein [Prevotellaceae bacterium]
MAYITTNTDIACSLTITKTVAGHLLSSYPKTYSLLDAFAGQPQITADAWRKMEEAQQTARINAFKAYINEVEQMDVDESQTNTPLRPSSETPNEIAEE